jgi:hypothetical protein
MSCDRALKVSFIAVLALVPLQTGCIPDLSELSQGENSSNVNTAGGPEMTAGSGGVAQQIGGGGNPSGGSGGVVDPSAGSGGSQQTGGAGAANMGMSGGGSNGGSGGSGGGAPACTPTGVEHCDGVDNDCNGVVDDGCPSGVSTVFQEDLPTVGDSSGGGAFAESCKDGEALVGLGLAVGGLISQVVGLCGVVHLTLSPNAPAGYAVTLTAGSTLPAHPDTSPDLKQILACPENETIVGLRISQQNNNNQVIIPKIWINCAKLVLSKGSDGYSIDWEGMNQSAPVSGGLANDMAWYEDSGIPALHVATRIIGASGSWIDRIGLGISKLTVAVVQ